MAVSGPRPALATQEDTVRRRFGKRPGFGHAGVPYAWPDAGEIPLRLHWRVSSVAVSGPRPALATLGHLECGCLAVRGCAMPLAASGFPVRGHFGMRLGYGYAGEILCRAISGCAPVLDTLRGTGAWLFREAACGWPRWSALCVAISGCVPVWPRWGLLS